MWDYANKVFDSYPTEKRVVQKMIEIGLSVRIVLDEVKIFFDMVEVKPNALAKAYHVDRRVIVNLLKRIVDDVKLFDFFSNLKPVSNLSEAGSRMGFGVIQIIPENATKSGIIAGVISVISENDISIKEVITDDPDMIENPKAIIVTAVPLSGEIINKIKGINGVRGIVVL